MLLGSRTIGALGGSRVPRSRRPGGAGPHGLDAQQVRRLPRLKIPRCGLISRLPPNSNPPARSPPRPDERMAWCELRAGCMGHRAIGQSERRQRCAGDLFTRCAIASAFVARSCAAQRIENMDGVYRVRDNEPTPRIGAGLHKTP